MRQFFYIGYFLVLLLVYIFTSSYSVLTLLGASILALLISLVIFVFAQAEMKIHFPAIIEKNERATVTFESINKRLFPVPRLEYTVVFENALIGDKIETRLISSPAPKQKTESIFYMKGLRTGKIEVTVEDLRVTDFFGLFSKPLRNPSRSFGYVYPNLRTVDIAVSQLPEIPGEGERYYPGRRGSDVNEQLQLREYDEGDDLKRIHWKLSSKLDKLIVREFGLPIRYSIMIIIELLKPNRDTSMLLDECVETGLSLSTSLINFGINHNIAWYADGYLIVKEVSTPEDLTLVITELLSARSYSDIPRALDAYIQSDYVNVRLSPFYVSSVVDYEKISEIAVRQSLKTYVIANEHTQDAHLNMADHLDIEVVSISD